jgi:GT2 family glycosyltransferase
MAKHNIGVGFITRNNLVHWVMPITFMQMMSETDWTDYRMRVFTSWGGVVEKNRNKVVWQFLANNTCDYLLFIDWDNGLPANALPCFMEDFEDPDVNIVSGLYFVKLRTDQQCLGLKMKGADLYTIEPHMFAGDRLINMNEIETVDKAMVGGGCLMIRREVFEKLKEPWFQSEWIFSNFPGEHGWLLKTEDVWFCEKAQEAGYNIHLDTRIKSPHMQHDECFPELWKPY